VAQCGGGGAGRRGAAEEELEVGKEAQAGSAEPQAMQQEVEVETDRYDPWPPEVVKVGPRIELWVAELNRMETCRQQPP
jgi:hypothetical protein